MKDEDSKKVLPEYNIREFQLTRILQNNIVRKYCALLGKFPNSEENAIVLLEKTAFDENQLQTDGVEDKVEIPKDKNGSTSGYFSKDLVVNTEFVNNIYGSFLCVPGGPLNNIKTTVVYPATEKHIEKYSICKKILINETPDMYANLTLPHLQASQLSLEWVYNILEKKQEKERIVHEDADEDAGFVMLPDLKWDGKNVDSLYLLVIVNKRNIKSIRDLKEEHLPLLKNIRSSAAEAIGRLYGIKSECLRMYFHYQPSFYHLHLHINPIGNDAPGIWCEKSHMLDTVISNLELVPDYYQRACLPFVLYEGSKLYEIYQNETTSRKRICVEK